MEPTIRVTVQVPKTVFITAAEKQMIEALGNVNQGSRVQMIKFIKNQHDTDLATAKAVVDLIVGHDPYSYVRPEPMRKPDHVPGTTTLGDLLRAKLG